ncbi:hypothetical protein MMC11_006386 [Xylographa trunciseda]|nr:hypothetical protein [Xylographa trunciseda]
MPDKDALTPRVFLIRHGQTAWSLSGQFTSTTDLSLTAYGLAQVRSTARILYGPGRVLSPARIAAVLVSPRKRAQETAGAIFGGAGEGKWETAPELAEWEYGDYEGLLTGEIRALRRERGLDGGEGREWDIWRDGCEGGE